MLRRVPWIVWALLAPLVLLGAYRLVVGPGRRVEVVGSGVLASLRAEDAPEGSRYVLEVEAHETGAETERRVREVISTWPDVIVIAFDASAVDADQTAARFRALAEAAENATAVPVLVGFEASERWFETLCDGPSRRLCVEPGTDPAGAIAAGVEEAWERQRALQASTQVGR